MTARHQQWKPSAEKNKKQKQKQEEEEAHQEHIVQDQSFWMIHLFERAG
jgi:ribosomal silencing factor RsfS